MARKKLSEMTPIERVEERMKGMTWEEAEDVGVEILARCLASHVHIHKDGEEYLDKIMKRVCTRCVEWSQDNAHVLAAASAGLRLAEKLKGMGSNEQP